MKLFWKNIGSKKSIDLQITENDREWVESNFQWLVKVYGHPKSEQVSITDKWFPKTLKSREITIDNLIKDCCNHLGLDKELFSYEIFEDIRDTSNTPYAFEKHPIDCFLYFDKPTKRYKIELSNNIFKHPNRLVSALCYEFTKARLIHSKVEYDTGTETNLFLYLASVYFGYGLIIGKNLIDIGMKTDGFWETKWSYVSDIPYQVMAYAIATFASLKNNFNPQWKTELSKEIQTEFELSIDYIKKTKTELFDARRIDNSLNAEKLFEVADNQYQSGEISRAISTLQKIIFMTDDSMLKSDIYNNIGYYKLRLGNYKNSISDFENALKHDENYGYANDNLGFALIMTNNFEKGKFYVEKAMQTKNNDNAYSFRNFALYFQKKGEFELAKCNFKKAFDFNTQVDLLDFYYGKFLIEIGEKEKGLEHIKLSSDFGEKEGIEYLEMNNN